VLEERCRQLEIADRVTFAGYHSDAHRFLGVMDVFVMPSLFESWGFVAVEAMAAGCPVVCTDIPGPSFFVRHERTGLVVPAGDPAAIAAAVRRLRRDPGLRERLVRAAKAHVYEEISVERMVDKYDRIYSAPYVKGGPIRGNPVKPSVAPE
jgi:glycosyltransferase involved in cell wall biosynthesis